MTTAKMDFDRVLGTIVSVKRGDLVLDAELLESREGVSGPEVYCHYIDYDRRNDEWMPVERIIFSSSLLNNESAPLSVVKQKRKLEMSPEGGDRYRHQHHHGSTSHTMDPTLFSRLEAEREDITKVKNIAKIQLGRWEIEAWYYSPYPDFVSGHDCLYICEYTLKYTKNKKAWVQHRKTCKESGPPGKQIYSDGIVSLWEVNGSEHQVYCQNLCLLSKLFLDHKTLYYDTDPFLFYILTEYREDPLFGNGHQLIGYFSKEKFSELEYNLACILTFPPYQRCGYGKLLISFSYELTKREGKVGSPEKPLSDLGKLSYRSYWTYVLLTLLVKYDGKNNMQGLSQLTGIKMEDVISTLRALDLVKYWKGQYVIVVNRDRLSDHFNKLSPPRLCDPSKLVWEPKLASTELC